LVTPLSLYQEEARKIKPPEVLAEFPNYLKGVKAHDI